MAIQGKFFKLCSLWTCSKNVFAGTNRYTPTLQHVAFLRKESVEEKFKIPPKPKRPLTPFFKYLQQIRPELVKANPKAKLTDYVKETALRWEKVDPQMKAKLDEEFRKEQEIYSKLKLDFDSSLTEEQKMALKQDRLERSEDRLKRKHRKKCRENNKPKKPCSAYVLYLKSQLPNRKPTDNFKEWQMSIARKWNNLPEEEKKPFMDEMKDGFKEYQLKMTAWERDMIKQGKLDIVRQDSLIEPRPVKTKSKKKTEKTE